jgi:K+ transporter
VRQKISAARSISIASFIFGEPGGRLLRWRLPLFAFLFRNSAQAVDLFNLPPRNFLEIGRQIEI